MEPEFQALWEEALPWSAFFNQSMEQWNLWDGVYRHVKIPDWAIAAAARPGGLHLLVITEDWCGDAANTVPVLVRLAEKVPGVDLRILPRDQYPGIMSRYLTQGSSSIPIVIGLDREFRELGHWGPRPGELQAWIMANRAAVPKDRRYAEARRWYAKDKGESTLREVLAALGLEGPAGSHREVEAVPAAGKVHGEHGRPEHPDRQTGTAAERGGTA